MKKIFIATVVILSMSSCNYMNTKQMNDVTVIDKERVNDKESSYYLIYTNKGEFTLEDELFRGNFRSSNWYGRIEKGRTYNFKVGGYRVGFLSMYPNIHSKPIEVNNSKTN